jgi:hypothetical protein
MKKFIELVKYLQEVVPYRWYCLEETWQRGYSWSYRWFRFKEAFGFNPNIGVKPTLTLIEYWDDKNDSH